MKVDDAWLFAYGSNLDKKQMKDRTGSVREATLVYVENYCFAFNVKNPRGRIVANIIPRKGGKVWGVVYLCSAKALDDMDAFEGVQNRVYRRERLVVNTLAGEQLFAVAYLGEAKFCCAPSKPGQAYLNRILTGGRSHKLPSRYIRKIKALGQSDQVIRGNEKV